MVMKKKRLRKSEIRQLNEEVGHYGYSADKKDDVEIMNLENHDVVSVNGEILFFYHEGKLMPTLKLLLKGVNMKKVVVDMGAVKFVAGGADIMRPGIVEIDDRIDVGDAVAIVDENNKKPLAVGIAMFGSEDMRACESGKVLKSIHHIGDRLWNA
jgi:PUA domain protein